MEKHFISRRSMLTLGGAAVVSSPWAHAASTYPVLVELFTSQGCSSCPPADKLAGKLAKDLNMFVVSFNVDYWDYLGWRDTLAKREYSQRQYDYAKQRGDADVYTPQMVINGAKHVVGSNQALVLKEIAEAGSKPPAVMMSLQITARDVEVNIPETPFAGEATLWLMAVEAEVRQTIKRGENAGQEVAYTNVVRQLVPAAKWKGEAYHGSWMRNAVMPRNCETMVAVLQENQTGPVLGFTHTQA